MNEDKKNEQACEQCDAKGESGPVREGGGTTGAGNLSPGGASRTGGATSGVQNQKPQEIHRKHVPPDA